MLTRHTTLLSIHRPAVSQHTSR